MNKEYFTDNLSIEAMAEITDEILRFEKNNKSRDIKTNFFKLIPVAAAFVFVIGLINILPIFHVFNDTTPGSNAPAENSYILPSDATEFKISEEDNNAAINREQYLASYAEFKAMNPNFYGWIRANYTKEKLNEGIPSYPLVHIIDNEYYLNHSFLEDNTNSEASSSASRNIVDILNNRNTVIYGQSMINGTMFSMLEEYIHNEDSFNGGIIEILTDNATYYYEVFSARSEPMPGNVRNALVTDNALLTEDEINIKFDNEEEYIEYLYEMKRRSVFQKNIEFDDNSQIITLSTLIHNVDPNVNPNKRVIVQGVLIDITDRK